MSSFNLSSTHPLIPNSNQYYIDKKYVSIHSEDRDIIKYPRSGQRNGHTLPARPQPRSRIRAAAASGGAYG